MTTFARFVALLLLALSVLAAGCGGKEERKTTHMEKGKAYFAQAEYDKARVEFRNVLQIDPKTADAYYMVGLIEEEQQNWQRAFDNYRKAIEVNPALIDAKVRLGRLYLLSGALREGEATMMQVLAAKPDDPGGRFLKAAVLVRKGDVDGAIREAAEVVNADPKELDAVSLLAGLYVRQGDDARAEQVLEEGVKDNPRSVPLHVDLAGVAARRNQLEKAEKAYIDVIALEPKTLRYRTSLANFYIGTKQPEKAEKTLREAVAADPEDWQRYLLLAQFLARQKGVSDAEKELVSAIDQSGPRAYPLRFALGRLYEATGRPAQAERTYQDIVSTARTEPEGLDARVQLARINRAIGNTAEAEKLIGEVLSENPKDSDALLLRGQLSLVKGDAKQSVADLRAVLKDRPDSIEILSLLASAHMGENEPQLARDVFNNAITRYPNNDNLRMAFIEFLLASKDYDGALREADTALNANPENVRAYELRADAQAAKKDWRGAEETLGKLAKLVPSQPAGPYRLGLLYVNEGKGDQAIGQLELASHRAPKALEPLAAIVSVLVGQGKPDKAIARVNQAIAANPDNPFAHMLLGDLYAKEHKAADAEAAFRRAIAIEPRAPGPYVGLAKLYASSGDAKRAISVLEPALGTNAGELLLMESLAEIYQMAGDREKAIAEYEKVLVKDPGADAAANNLAWLLIGANGEKPNLERALALTKRFENSSNPSTLDTLGWTYFLMGRNDRAISILQRAVAGLDIPAVQYHLGMALYKQGDVKSAKMRLQAAVDAKQDFPGIQEAKAVLGKL